LHGFFLLTGGWIKKLPVRCGPEVGKQLGNVETYFISVSDCQYVSGNGKALTAAGM